MMQITKTKKVVATMANELHKLGYTLSKAFNMFAIMLHTGMRSGEVRGLKYNDIDKKEKRNPCAAHIKVP